MKKLKNPFTKGDKIKLKTPVTLYINGESNTVSIQTYYTLTLEKQYTQTLLFSLHFNKIKTDPSSAKSGDVVRIDRDRLDVLRFTKV